MATQSVTVMVAIGTVPVARKETLSLLTVPAIPHEDNDHMRPATARQRQWVSGGQFAGADPNSRRIEAPARRTPLPN